MAKKSGLGANFGGLFDDAGDLFSESASGGIQMLKIGEVEPNRNQPRKDFDVNALNVLAESIIEHGIIQPLTVRPKDGGYQIVAGERRWRAAKIAGLSEVPVRIMELTDLQTMQIALIENLQREDLNAIEESLGYKELIESFGMTQDEVGKTVGKGRSSVTNSLRLLNLPQPVQALVRDNKLSVGHCKVLLSVEKSSEQIKLAQRIDKEKLSVRELENILKTAEKPTPATPKQKKDSYLTEVSLSVGEVLKKPVRVVQGKNKFTLEIDVFSKEELTELANFLGK